MSKIKLTFDLTAVREDDRLDLINYASALSASQKKAELIKHFEKIDNAKAKAEAKALLETSQEYKNEQEAEAQKRKLIEEEIEDILTDTSCDVYVVNFLLRGFKGYRIFREETPSKIFANKIRRLGGRVYARESCKLID